MTFWHGDDDALKQLLKGNVEGILLPYFLNLFNSWVKIPSHILTPHICIQETASAIHIWPNIRESALNLISMQKDKEIWHKF